MGILLFHLCGCVSSNTNEVIKPVLNFLFFFTIRFHKYKKAFFYQYRLEVDLVLYTYVFIYLKVTIRKNHFYLSFSNLVRPTFSS